jgi:hypothetical protein
MIQTFHCRRCQAVNQVDLRPGEEFEIVEPGALYGLDAAIWEALTARPGGYLKMSVIMGLAGVRANRITYYRRLTALEAAGVVERLAAHPKYGWRAAVRRKRVEQLAFSFVPSLDRMVG